MSPVTPEQADFSALMEQHLRVLYPDLPLAPLIGRIEAIFADAAESDLIAHPVAPSVPQNLWTSEDCWLITYGDTLRRDDEAPLKTLRQFLKTHVGNSISAVHVLPFCPFSSDDGFAVIDYRAINPELGSWEDISDLATDYDLMADLVINHVSSESEWFQNYVQGKEPGAGYFVEANEDDDLSEVVRPRASPLLRPTETVNGLRQLWCTFSHDQVDLNFANPDVLLEFLQIIRLYLEKGVRIFRLDAIGYLWKEPGTTSIHLPQTHEVVRLIRTVVDHYAPGAILITETNVPNHENLSYFGNRNEAHVIYNFSLAPLVVHSLLTGKTEYLKRWMMSMPPAPVGCTYLNFTASHDGIGMRPAEGLLSDEEQSQMVEAIRSFGGRVSTRRTADGGEKVYELNIALFDAMKGTLDGPDHLQIERFLCSQTVMMAIEGIPAFYIHSLLATPNDTAGVEATGHNRSINRHKWDFEELQSRLANADSPQHRVFFEIRQRLAIRKAQPAFHPNATQFTLQLSPCFFAFWRQSMDRSQSIFAIHNMTKDPQELRLADLNLIALDSWHDAISGQPFKDLNDSLQLNPYQCLWITNRSE